MLLEKLKLSKEEAIRLYPQANELEKSILEQTFGKECFYTNIMDRVKTFADICREAGVCESNVYNSCVDTNDEIAYKKIKLIVKVLNEGWVPNFDDTNEKKWCPYFNLSSGFRFCVSFYLYDWTYTGGGVRLCFKSEALATYAGRQFENIYKDYLK